MTVGEAAEALGVDPSRVRQLIAAGSLPARRAGRQWMIEPAAVERRRRSRRKAGRPMNPDGAWEALHGLALRFSGGDSDRSSSAQDRVRRIAGLGIGDAATLLARRSDVHRLYVHPGVLGRIGDVPGVVMRRPEDLDLPLVGTGATIAYIGDKAVDAVRGALGAEDEQACPNLLLHALPLESVQDIAAEALDVAYLLDLHGSDDPRDRAAAEDRWNALRRRRRTRKSAPR
jgi:excisionase family DNA binding protein